MRPLLSLMGFFLFQLFTLFFQLIHNSLSSLRLYFYIFSPYAVCLLLQICFSSSLRLSVRTSIEFHLNFSQANLILFFKDSSFYCLKFTLDKSRHTQTGQ